MKHISILALVIGMLAIRAVAGDALPFPVTVGGQSAKDGSPFAQLSDPVPPDAAIEVGVKADLVIVNVHKAKADGSPDEAAQPAVILMQGTTKSALDQSMDKRKFAPGKYLLSITAGEKTASIQFSVK